MWKQLYSDGDHQGDKRQSLNTISKLFLVVTPQNIIISFGGFPEALNGNYFEGKKKMTTCQCLHQQHIHKNCNDVKKISMVPVQE